MAAVKLTSGLQQMYSLSEMSPPNALEMTVCYGFVCRLRIDLPFMADERKLITEMMNSSGIAWSSRLRMYTGMDMVA